MSMQTGTFYLKNVSPSDLMTLTKIVEDKPHVKSAAFRGVELRGLTIPVPEGYQGLVIRDEGKENEEGDGPLWEVQNRFTDFTYWNREEEADATSSTMARLIHWTQFSDKIHESVSEEEVAQRTALRKKITS